MAYVSQFDFFKIFSFFLFSLSEFYLVQIPSSHFINVANLKLFKSMQNLLQNKTFCFKTEKENSLNKKRKKRPGAPFWPNGQSRPSPLTPLTRSSMPARRPAADSRGPPVSTPVVPDESASATEAAVVRSCATPKP
jgi:hypothetical protein